MKVFLSYAHEDYRCWELTSDNRTGEGSESIYVETRPDSSKLLPQTIIKIASILVSLGD